MANRIVMTLPVVVGNKAAAKPVAKTVSAAKTAANTAKPTRAGSHRPRLRVAMKDAIRMSGVRFA